MSRLLRFSPDTPETRAASIEVGDVAAAEESAGTSFPDISAPPFPWDAYADYLLDGSISGGPIFLMPGPEVGYTYLLTDRALLAFGFSPPFVEQYVAVELPGDGRRVLAVALGPFEEAEILSHLEACTSCQPTEVEETVGDWSVRGWGPNSAASDPSMQFALPFYDLSGRGGRMAFRDGAVARAILTADLHEVLRADAGEVPSLADVASYRDLAAQADALVALFMSVDRQERTVAPTAQGPFIDPWALRATVWTADRRALADPELTLLVYSSEEVAGETADRLRERAGQNDFGSLMPEFEVGYSGTVDVIRHSATEQAPRHLEFLLAEAPTP